MTGPRQSYIGEQAKYAADSPTPKKRQGWIKRMLSRSRDDDNSAIENLVLNSPRIDRGGPQIDQPDRAIQFTVYNANGGRIVETRRYNTKTDRSTNGLYVITGEQNFGNEIDKIITMEALKQ